jgi:hypothetical protein
MISLNSILVSFTSLLQVGNTEILKMFIDIGAYGIDITNEDINSDIELFIRDQLASRFGFKRWEVDIKNKITAALKKGAKGMYGLLFFSSAFLSANSFKVPLGSLSFRRTRGLIKLEYTFDQPWCPYL